MKKVMVLTAIFALSVSAISEAKGARGGRSSGASRPVATKPALPAKQTQATQNTQQPDATFNQQAIQNATNKAPINQGNRLASFATGAAAGYLLSEVLTPSDAHAQTPNQQHTASGQVATPNNQMTDVKNQTTPTHAPTFRAFDAANPALVGIAGNQNLYCLNGVLYLMNTANNQLVAITDYRTQPLSCHIAP